MDYQHFRQLDDVTIITIVFVVIIIIIIIVVIISDCFSSFCSLHIYLLQNHNIVFVLVLRKRQ